MSITDLISAGFWSFMVLCTAFVIQQTFYRGKTMGWFLYSAFAVKILGGLLFTAIYKFYYGTGDTIGYFIRGKWMAEKFVHDPSDFWAIANLGEGANMLKYPDSLGLFFNETTMLVVKLCAVLNLLSFDSLWGSAVLFSALSVLGTWLLFLVFVDLYPDMPYRMAFSTIFIPSLFFWGSGIMKDTLVFASMGMLVGGFYFCFIKRKEFLFSIPLILVSMYIIGISKAYVLFALIPTLGIWLLMHWWMNFKTIGTRSFIAIVFLVICGPLLILFMSRFGNSAAEAVIYQFAVALRYQIWHTIMEGANNSSYNLGTIDYSIVGIIKKIPAAIYVALFRPHLFEVKTAIMVPSFVESNLFLLATIYVWFRAGFLGFWRIMFSRPELVAFLFFVLALGFITGFSSFNFGSLVRYKIPLLPFHAFILFVVHEQVMKRKRLKTQAAL